MYIDFEGAPDGTTISASVLQASTHCGNGTWSYFTHNPMTGMTISTTAQKRLVAPVTACGTQYTDAAGTRGLRYDMSQTGRSVYYTWPTASNTASAGFFYKIGVVDDNWYSVFAITAQGHDFTMLHMHGGDMYLETWAGITNPIPIAANTWYWITMQYNAGGTHYLHVYETANWTLLGSAQNVSTGNWKPDGIELGRTGSEPGYPASYWYYDQIVVDYATGRFPLVQGTPASLMSIAVAPANPSIAAGTTQPFTATGTFSDGTTRSITSSVAWSSSDTTIALISSAGIASGQVAGSTTITATSGSIGGSTSLTVTPAPPAPPPPSPSGVTAYVQSASANDHYNTTSASARFTGNVTATNAIAVLCAWQGLSQTLTGVTDTQGNAYTIVDNPTSGTYGRAAMAYAIARASASNTVSCNFSTAGMGKSIVVHEISGVDTTAPLDGHRMTVRASPGTGTNAIGSGTIQTTANGDYIVGFTFNDSSNAAAWNAGTGYTKRQDLRVASYTAASEDRIQAAAGPVDATFTATTAGYGEFITGILAFRSR